MSSILGYIMLYIYIHIPLCPPYSPTTSPFLVGIFHEYTRHCHIDVSKSPRLWGRKWISFKATSGTCREDWDVGGMERIVSGCPFNMGYDMGGSINEGTPKIDDLYWNLRNKMDYLGYPNFREPPYTLQKFLISFGVSILRHSHKSMKRLQQDRIYCTGWTG